MGETQPSPLTRKIETFDKIIELAKVVIDHSKLTRVSIMVSAVHRGKDVNELIVFGHTSPAEIPIAELVAFFQAIGDRFIAEKLQYGSQGEPITIDRRGNTDPKSPCCGATMYAINKPWELLPGSTTIDFIYCSFCNRKLDGNGKIILPEQFYFPFKSKL